MTKFYALSPLERRDALIAEGVSPDTIEKLIVNGAGDGHLTWLNAMSENVIGSFCLPLGIVRSLIVNDDAHILPMVTEEPSVIAGANKAAKIFNASGGVLAEGQRNTVVGQIQVIVPKGQKAQLLARQVLVKRADYLSIANACDPQLVAAGGGAFELNYHVLEAASDSTPEAFIVFDLGVHTVEAMGANAVNTMCEAVLRAMQADFDLEAGLAILTNASERMVRARVRIPYDVIDGLGGFSAKDLARRMRMASDFALRDPARAVTHNKGIFNGIVALAMALGQDTRALQAAAYHYALRTGQHQPLAVWKDDADALTGFLELPLLLGYVGGARKLHPGVEAAFELAHIDSCDRLCQCAAALGLAQNFAALLALATEGIQAGHMVCARREPS